MLTGKIFTMQKILFILTSHADMLNTDTNTGVWLSEFTDPFYEFLDAGYEVVLASPKGGQPPVDEMSKLTEHITSSNRRFNDDAAAQAEFANTLPLESINPDEYTAVFFPGGHGPIWDLADSATVGKIIQSFHAQGKVIGAVCHGSAAFISAGKQDAQFLQGKRLSCFSNAEEKLTGKEDHIPYLLEDVLREMGAEIDNTVIPFAPHTIVDGNLITGQNPLSAGPTAKKMIEMVKGTV